MKVLKGIKELGAFAKVEEREVIRAYNSYAGHGYILLKGTEYLQHDIEGVTHFILLESESDEECKKYMMKYESKEFVWKCFIDEVEGLQEVELLDIENKSMEIKRATVKSKNGTIVNRNVEFILFEEELSQKGNVYFLERE